MASTQLTTQNITTRQQLIETERNTRKLAQQKRDERKDAFLSAQKQLLKTTEYIQQLDELSHTFTASIQNTSHLLNNYNIHTANLTHHHFLSDINKFNVKPTELEHTHKDNTIDNVHNLGMDATDYTEYDIEPLIEAFDSILAGNDFYDEGYLMNHIDVPFLSTYQDIPLFLEKIQSCLYSSCIYMKRSKAMESKYDDEETDEHDDVAFFHHDLKLKHAVHAKQAAKSVISVDQYCSYLSAREILIEKLLHFMLAYPKLDSSNQQSADSKHNDNEHAQTMKVEEYYEQILPFCLYSLIVIQYQSAMYVEEQHDKNASDESNLYKLFEDFIHKTRQKIQLNVVQCLQFVNDKPSLLIACLNEYNHLLCCTKPSKHSSQSLQWTKMFKQLYETANHRQQNNSRHRANAKQQQMKFMDFISDYSFHSSFYQCLQSMSQIVCHSLAENFNMLFAKLSTRSNAETQPTDVSNPNNPDSDEEHKDDRKQPETAPNTLPSSFSEIMNRIQQNLSAILTFDHHRKLLKSPLLSAFLDENITPYIQKSTTQTITEFVSKLEVHLNKTDNAYKHAKSTSFSLDEEYLEIGICCEKLECFIMTVIDEQQSKSHDDKEHRHDADDSINTPISICLMDMLSSISSLKSRALKYWSSAMSGKLFGEIALYLENKLSFWKQYESYYTKTIWKCITVKSGHNADDGDNNDNDDDIEELTINIPCHPSEYIHEICFQFIQILLMIATQPHVPNTIIGVLENEFRSSTSIELNKIFRQFFEKHSDEDISELLGLQFYFDISFARSILATDASRKLWQQILTTITDNYIELVTMEYASKYLESEIRKSVNSCLLMYGVRSSAEKDRQSSENEKKQREETAANKTNNMIEGSGGNIFARPTKKIPRIALLPVASYQISQSALSKEENRSSLANSRTSVRMGMLTSPLLTSPNQATNTKETITESFSQITSGAMSHANTLLKNFGSMFQ